MKALLTFLIIYLATGNLAQFKANVSGKAHADAEKGLIFWNTLDSKAEIKNSRIGPDGQMTRPIFPEN